ncbi:MAG: flagellar basal body rod C-terminal domain-containing protein [Pseudomonadota bacterium]
MIRGMDAALAGLAANRQGLNTVAENVAGARDPNHVKRRVDITNSEGNIVVARVTRELDDMLLNQVREAEGSWQGKDTLSKYLTRIDEAFGSGDQSQDRTISRYLTDLANKLNIVASSPENNAASNDVILTAKVVAEELNRLGGLMLNIRQDAENKIDTIVKEIGTRLETITQLNRQISTLKYRGQDPSALMDVRDKDIRYVVAQLGARVTYHDNGFVTLRTRKGHELVNGNHRADLGFDGRTGITERDAHHVDPAKRGVGAIILRNNAVKSDLILDRDLGDSNLAALVDVRDTIAPQVSRALDRLAHNLATQLSYREVNASLERDANNVITSATIPKQELVAPGDALKITINAPGRGTVTHTIVGTADAGQARGNPDRFYLDPGDIYGSYHRVASKLGQKLGTQFDVTVNLEGDIVIRDNFTPPGDGFSIHSAHYLVRAGSSDNQDPSGLRMFADKTGEDGQLDYLSKANLNSDEFIGFARRITVHKGLLEDPSLLTSYENNNGTGDHSRPIALYERMVGRVSFPPDTGIGTASQPFVGSMGEFLDRVISNYGSQALSVKDQAEGQKMRYDMLSSKLQQRSGVDVDEEMADMLAFQRAYAANARVVRAADAILEIMVNLGR